MRSGHAHRRRGTAPRLWLTLSLAHLTIQFFGCDKAPTSTTTGRPGPIAGSPEPSDETAPRPQWRTIGKEHGLDFARYDDIRGQHRILEANGGGAGLFDFDRDGRFDVFFTNGCRLPIEPDDRETPSRLFRRQSGRFVPGSAARIVQFGFANGCAVGDFDADGFDDLYVTTLRSNVLWRNNGDGTFSDVTNETGTDVPAWSTSAAFADVNGDGLLDLYVVNYLAESDQSPTLCPHPDSPDGYVSCPPSQFDGVEDALLLSSGEGRFRDISAAAGIGGLAGRGLGVVIADLGNDRRPEIYVANDGQANFLFVAKNGEGAGTGDVRYVESALLNGVALDESGFGQASMGIAAGDCDADGDIDLFLTHFLEESNTLYANQGGLRFGDATRRANLKASSWQKLGFGTEFLDYDADGRLDLVAANGHIEDRTWNGEPYRMHPQLYWNDRGGAFVDVSDEAGDYFGREWLGRGIARGDLNGDGRVDLVVSHQLAESVALLNETQTENNSLVLHPIGTVSNRTGYGVRVEVTDAEFTVVRELTGGGSFQSASAPEMHIGLGSRTTATIHVRWPSGLEEQHADLPAGAWMLVEGRGVWRRPAADDGI